jgi:hypothetical protein
MSGPMVSGSVGLLLQHQENLHPGVSLLSSTMKALILHSADDMISGAPGPDYRYGWGLMDTEKAAAIMSRNASFNGIHVYELNISNGGQVSIPLKAIGGEPLRATIAWTDAPGTPVAAALNPADLMLVNDLDMRLTSSTNVSHEPYVLDPANPANPAGTGDNFRDNVEMVHIDWPGAEEMYTLTVTHKGTIDGGNQTFSLIVTGNQPASGVSNPQSFTATANGTDQIDLQWTQNAEGHEVMLVWSEGSSFGIPDDGTVYFPGQQINGGGTVLYRGSQASFSHTELDEGTTYYYKAFSYNASDEYSYGRAAFASTDVILYGEPPRSLSGTVENLVDVGLSWSSPILNDGFEQYDDFVLSFGSYTQRDVDGSSTYSIQNVTFPNQGYTGSFILFNPHETDPPLSGNWLAYEGQKYAACFAAINPPNNDWLITPKITVSEGEWLSFFAKSITDAYGLERFRVGVSTTGTQPGDFSIISAGSHLEVPTTWTEFTFDLSAYAGQEVYLAINCVSNDAYAFLVDALKILENPPVKVFQNLADEPIPAHSHAFLSEKQQGAPGPAMKAREEAAAKSFSTYSIYRDASYVGSTSDFSYTDTGLAPGTYIYTVKANYVNPAFQSDASNTAEVSITTRAWTGINSADWFSAGNWKGTQVPAGTEDVLIPASGVTHLPVIAGGLAESKDLNIQNGTSLAIAGDGQLSVNGVLSNESGVEGLVIDDGGTLLHQNTGVAATMKHDIPFGGWHFISAPVGQQTIIGSDFVPSDNPLPSTFDFYFFDESEASNVWINVRGAAGAPNPSFDESFVAGKGYLVAYFPGYGASPPFRYQGQLHSGDLSVSLGFTSGREWAGWNLIGNPFPSGINWGLTEKEGITEDNYAYIYDAAANNYIYQDGGIIAAGQGFFVKVGGAEKSLSFANINRVHGGSYTKEEEAEESLVLRLGNTSHYDKTTIRIVEESSFSRDREDALKLFSFAGHMPQLYSYTADQVRVAVNSLPDISREQPIRLGINIPSDNTYMLSVEGTSDAFRLVPLFLKDLKTGLLHNLKVNPQYSFQAAKDDDADRFLLYFTEAVTEVYEVSDPPLLRAWYHQRSLYVECLEESVQVAVYDLNGRKMLGFEQGRGVQAYNPGLPAGVYVVQLRGVDSIVVVRLVVAE